jgi:predicted dehydrogenase
MKQNNDFKNPIYIIGAGGIIANAHMPAYQIANFNIVGITDLDFNIAKKIAKQFDIPSVFESLEKMLENLLPNAVFDIAVPAHQILNIINLLPNKSVVLIQKPLGENLEQAKMIEKKCAEKSIIAAVNFQLRYAPYIIEAKNILKSIGEISAIEINVNVYTPWHLWDFLAQSNRVEILYHSIHYIDLIKSFLGLPKTIYAKTTKHIEMENMASVRSNIIFDYGNYIQASILTNHCHKYGIEKQQSYIKLETNNGAIRINFGALIDYPNGIPDTMEFINLTNNKGWQNVQLNGTWFPHAFIGSMQEVLLAANHQNYLPDNHINSAVDTMACVEAAYISNQSGGISLNNLSNE